MRKRNVLLIIAFFGFIACTGAPQNSPSAVVKSFFRSYYEKDTSTFLDCINPDDRELVVRIFGEEGMTMFLNMFMDVMTAVLQDDLSSLRNVKILSEEVSGDKATVRIDIEGSQPLDLVRIQGTWKIDMGFSSLNDFYGF